MKRTKKIIGNLLSFPGTAFLVVVLSFIWIFWDRDIVEKAERFIAKGKDNKPLKTKVDIGFHLLNILIWIMLFFIFKP